MIEEAEATLALKTKSYENMSKALTEDNEENKAILAGLLLKK